LTILPDKIEEYLLDLHHVADPLVGEMEALARERNFPIVGPLVGRLLEITARLVQPRRVLELGSGFGYSAYWIARGMAKGSRITLTDRDPENLRLAREFLARAQLDPDVETREGEALEALEAEDGELDLVFCDVDKKLYPRVLDPVARRLRPGGVFLVDNTLWSGRVVERDEDEATRAIQVFNRLLLRDPRFSATILPIRDGVALAVRLPGA
jgi:predicted O-methyltransferase YrrM